VGKIAVLFKPFVDKVNEILGQCRRPFVVSSLSPIVYIVIHPEDIRR